MEKTFLRHHTSMYCYIAWSLSSWCVYWLSTRGVSHRTYTRAQAKKYKQQSSAARSFHHAYNPQKSASASSPLRRIDYFADDKATVLYCVPYSAAYSIDFCDGQTTKGSTGRSNQYSPSSTCIRYTSILGTHTYLQGFLLGARTMAAFSMPTGLWSSAAVPACIFFSVLRPPAAHLLCVTARIAERDKDSSLRVELVIISSQSWRDPSAWD